MVGPLWVRPWSTCCKVSPEIMDHSLSHNNHFMHCK
jgi:hypothetical protein